jgi:L-asparaginase II
VTASRCEVAVSRSGKVESVHRVSFAVVDEAGKLLLSAGESGMRTFFRSSAKPLQALPLLEAGGEQAFGLDSAEIAVTSASHDGEKVHIDTVGSILSKIGLEERYLFCGPHDPYSIQAARALAREGKEPARLHNNCSGKHSGMLAMCVLNGWQVEGYQLPDHPVQRHIFDVVAQAVDQPASALEYGTDGCGVPTFYLSILQMAVAYGSLSRWSKTEGGRGDAVRRLFRAIRERPVLLEGSTGFSSALSSATDGRVVGKVGGEGLFCIVVPQEGLGAAIKVHDGNRRATSPAAVELLRTLGVIRERELLALSAHHSPTLVNHQGMEIGRLCPQITSEK